MSYISLSQLNKPGIRFILLLILYSSALIATMLWQHLPFLHRSVSALSMDTADVPKSSNHFDMKKLDNSIMDAFDIITRVGGYVILFSIAAQIITDTLTGSSPFKLILLGFLEITTGINKISTAPLSMDLKIALITMITAFGGLSGLAQTNSVISNTRLSIRTYFIQKVLHMFIALFMVILYVQIS
jgi:hypothetical protein